MSQETVDIVRRLYDAAARRDSEAILALYDPEVEWDVSRTHAAVMEGLYRGHDGLRAWAREWYDAWENLEYDVAELIDAGDEVISVVSVRGRGRTSRAEVEFARHAGLWTIREGKIVRVVWFPTRAAALEAADRSEC